MPVALALYQPDIPQNVGAAIRLCACLGVPLSVIHPCGFPWDERKIRSAALDYWDALTLTRHESWGAYRDAAAGRTILLTTRADYSYLDFAFRAGDTLLLGRESAGVPVDVHNSCDARITIPMAAGMRSLNVITAAAMVLGEALRQTRFTPTPVIGKTPFTQDGKNG